MTVEARIEPQDQRGFADKAGQRCTRQNVQTPHKKNRSANTRPAIIRRRPLEQPNGGPAGKLFRIPIGIDDWTFQSSCGGTPTICSVLNEQRQSTKNEQREERMKGWYSQGNGGAPRDRINYWFLQLSPWPFCLLVSLRDLSVCSSVSVLRFLPLFLSLLGGRSSSHV